MDEAQKQLDVLIRRALAGDTHALGEALVRQTPWMTAKVKATFERYSYLTADVDDLVQDTFLQATPAFKRFSPQGELVSSFCGWLAGILKHLLVNLIRKKQDGFLRLEQDILATHADQGLSPSRIVGQRQAFELLNGLIAQLWDPARKIIELEYFEGQSLNEIADALGMQPEAVNGQAFRARRWLHEQLGRSSLYDLRLTKKRRRKPNDER